MEAKYLKVTIHDNDFTSYADIMAKAIMDMLNWLQWKPTEESLDKLKPAIANIWNGFQMLRQAIDTRQDSNIYDYIMEHLDLSIEEFGNIPDFDNYEDLYIPLFECGEVLVI